MLAPRLEPGTSWILGFSSLESVGGSNIGRRMNVKIIILGAIKTHFSTMYRKSEGGKRSLSHGAKSAATVTPLWWPLQPSELFPRLWGGTGAGDGQKQDAAICFHDYFPPDVASIDQSSASTSAPTLLPRAFGHRMRRFLTI